MSSLSCKGRVSSRLIWSYLPTKEPKTNTHWQWEEQTQEGPGFSPARLSLFGVEGGQFTVWLRPAAAS